VWFAVVSPGHLHDGTTTSFHIPFYLLVIWSFGQLVVVVIFSHGWLRGAPNFILLPWRCSKSWSSLLLLFYSHVENNCCSYGKVRWVTGVNEKSTISLGSRQVVPSLWPVLQPWLLLIENYPWGSALLVICSYFSRTFNLMASIFSETVIFQYPYRAIMCKRESVEQLHVQWCNR